MTAPLSSARIPSVAAYNFLPESIRNAYVFVIGFALKIGSDIAVGINTEVLMCALGTSIVVASYEVAG